MKNYDYIVVSFESFDFRTFARYISRQTHTGPKFLHIQISNSIHTYLEEKERYRMIYHLYVNSKLEFPPRIPMFEHEKKFKSEIWQSIGHEMRPLIIFGH